MTVVLSCLALMKGARTCAAPETPVAATWSVRSLIHRVERKLLHVLVLPALFQQAKISAHKVP